LWARPGPFGGHYVACCLFLAGLRSSTTEDGIGESEEYLFAEPSPDSEFPPAPYFLRDLADVLEDVARFRLARRQTAAAGEAVRRVDALWQQWPKLAVSSSYDQGCRARLGRLLREVQGVALTGRT
jgi:hypothetical protein